MQLDVDVKPVNFYQEDENTYDRKKNLHETQMSVKWLTKKTLAALGSHAERG